MAKVLEKKRSSKERTYRSLSLHISQLENILWVHCIVLTQLIEVTINQNMTYICCRSKLCLKCVAFGACSFKGRYCTTIEKHENCRCLTFLLQKVDFFLNKTLFFSRNQGKRCLIFIQCQLYCMQSAFYKMGLA